MASSTETSSPDIIAALVGASTRWDDICFKPSGTTVPTVLASTRDLMRVLQRPELLGDSVDLATTLQELHSTNHDCMKHHDGSIYPLYPDATNRETFHEQTGWLFGRVSKLADLTRDSAIQDLMIGRPEFSAATKELAKLCLCSASLTGTYMKGLERIMQGSDWCTPEADKVPFNPMASVPPGEPTTNHA